MIRTKGLDHFALSVTELRRSERFYRDVLGFFVLVRGERQVNLRCGDLVLTLLEAGPGEVEGHAGCGVHFAFRVAPSDFNMALSELKRHEVPVREVKERKNSRSVYFPDPDGYELEIYAQNKEA